MKKIFKHLYIICLLTFCFMLLAGTCSNVPVANATEKSHVSSIISSDKKKPKTTKKPKATKKPKDTKKSKAEKKSAKKKADNGDTSYDYSWITKGATKDKNFNKYTNNFKTEAGSLVRFLTVVAITIAASSVIIIGMKYTWQKNGQQRRENHNQLVTIFLVICAILGLGTILALAQQIGQSLLK